MDVYLIVIGRKALTRPGFDYGRFITLLGDRNYGVSKIIFADDGESVVVPASPERSGLSYLPAIYPRLSDRLRAAKSMPI